jgi:hypothetical protein
MTLYAVNDISKDCDELLCWAPVRVFPTRERAEAVCRELRGDKDDPLARYEVAEVEVGPAQAAKTRSLAARRALYEALRAKFLCNCLDLFGAHPELESFSWQQEVYDDNRTGHSSLDVYEPMLKGGPGVDELRHRVNELIHTFDEHELEDLFGDLNLITVHRDGTVENDED